MCEKHTSTLAMTEFVKNIPLDMTEIVKNILKSAEHTQNSDSMEYPLQARQVTNKSRPTDN